MRHRFDSHASDGTVVQKTTRRHVVTLTYSRFEAVTVIRNGPQPTTDLLGASGADASPQGNHTTLCQDARLEELVPKGGTYGYDLIAHVGVETFLRGRALQDVANELSELEIPFSSLHDMQLKFLFYFGHLHRQAAPLVREHFQRNGHMTWLIDSTVEPDTPVYFGIREAQQGLFLGAWKLSTENADDVAPCLREASQQFGIPTKVLHDLSDAMTRACETVWQDTVPHCVCHFHLLRDIGEGLYAEPHGALRQLVRKLKLQPRLKEQRRGQTLWLREHIEDSTALARLLRGGNDEEECPEVLGREVLVAFHQWILDYASDGHRQGFPFDPYLLYFHRRIRRAAAAVERLLAIPCVRVHTPLVLRNFALMLQDYLKNERVTAAAAEFEQAYALFTRLRDALRLAARGTSPLHDQYTLEGIEVELVRKSLEELREECRVQGCNSTNVQVAKHHQIVYEHLDRYWQALFSDGPCRERTTNALERHWGQSKRCCRKRHGRRKLTRDFQSMPAELMLIPNLENAQYVDLVLGDISQLAARLAQAGQSAGPWTHWRQHQHPLHTARLPRRLLRQSQLIDNLVVTYETHCRKQDEAA
jgi:hypothetical protein